MGQALPSSDVDLHMRLEGLTCMYFFCIAVVISISTSVIVEYLDDKARHRGGARPRAMHEPMLYLDAHSVRGDPNGVSDGHAADAADDAAADDAALAPKRAARRLLVRERPREGALHVLLVLGQLGSIGVAFSTPLFARQMRGSMSELLRTHGFDFAGEYSLVQLGTLAAQAGGWDYLMASTFWVFIIVCPLLRGLSLLVLLLCPLRPAAASRLHRASRYVSYYFALEVMLLAVPLIHNAMGPMTANILSAKNFPLCKSLNHIYPNPPGEPSDLCFEIDVVAMEGYWLTVLAVAVFLLSGFDGSPTHKYIHRLLEPEDRPPPLACKLRRR